MDSTSHIAAYNKHIEKKDEEKVKEAGWWEQGMGKELMMLCLCGTIT